jgi:hypothetical protein
MEDSRGNRFELLRGRWKDHIAVDLYEDINGNLIETVREKGG